MTTNEVWILGATGRAGRTRPSGTVRDGWLRTGEGHEFTAAVAAEVTQRLLHGDGRPGAFAPGALFGSELAEAAGGTPTKTDRGVRPVTKG
jgi:hypothetical protein